MENAYNVRKENGYLVVDGIELKVKYGFCARPSALLARACSMFPGKVFIEKSGNEVDGKSIMGIMTLEAGLGSKMKVRVEDVEGARDLVGQLYRGITTETDFYPNFK
jgi:phosphocarrier protein HPr